MLNLKYFTPVLKCNFKSVGFIKVSVLNIKSQKKKINKILIYTILTMTQIKIMCIKGEKLLIITAFDEINKL